MSDLWIYGSLFMKTLFILGVAWANGKFLRYIFTMGEFSLKKKQQEAIICYLNWVIILIVLSALR